MFHLLHILATHSDGEWRVEGRVELEWVRRVEARVGSVEVRVMRVEVMVRKVRKVEVRGS